jgi:ABC-type phosphate transport system permease subunit
MIAAEVLSVNARSGESDPLKAVSPSIREAALGLGASRVQTTFHHVVPAAMPGILTGTIIGMAQALGETAPLLMIGMVAFIADVPQSIARFITIKSPNNTMIAAEVLSVNARSGESDHKYICTGSTVDGSAIL